MELVDPLQVLRLGEQHQVGVAPRPHQRERPQEVILGEVGAGGGEFALVPGALGGIEPAPGRIDPQECVLDEMALRHANARRTGRAWRARKV